MPISNPGEVTQAQLTAALETAAADAAAQIATHDGGANSHGAVSGTSKIALMHGGGRNIYVQSSQPTAENTNDLWPDTT